MLVLTLLAGCANLGQPVETASIPPGAPAVDEVLNDLAANDARIQSFLAAGSCDLESPEFDAIKRFRGFIRFRRPADLYVQGNQRLTNIPVFKLTCVGQDFLMEFPGSQDESFYQIEGEQFEGVPFSVSPSDIAREMFLSEDWGALGRRDARLTQYDATTDTATLVIGSAAKPRRLVDCVRIEADGQHWVVAKNTRLDDNGGTLATTTLSEYSSEDGALFPTKVDAVFPTEDTRMMFTMRNIRMNETIPDKYFQLRERARELNLEKKQASEDR